MAITITKIKINNQEIGGTFITVPLDIVTINWSFEVTTPSIKQLSYEIRIATHNVNWGFSSFIPNIIRQPYARDRSSYWKLKTKFLQRGESYYGQIRVKDTTGEESEWVKFSFHVNRLPFLTYASIKPDEPSEKDDLELDIGDTSENSIIKTKWFRNGIHYNQFDNYQKISKEYVRYGDSWYAEVTPDDGIEKGPTLFAKAKTITKKAPVADNLQILPINPNVNDILEASYIVNDPNSQSILLKDKSQIRWYINNSIVTEANDQKFVRFNLKPNDEVFFTITPSDGIFFGETVSSKNAIVQEAGFNIINLKVDGFIENLSVSSTNPTVEWDVIQPFDKVSRFANIKVGTSSGSDNVYNTIIETYDNKFTIPDNIVRRGIDYYVSVSSSDQKDIFNKYITSKFRVAGNLWEKEANNTKGWTLELSLSVSGDGYQRLSIGDGSRFSEIRFYSNKIELLLGKSNIKVFDLDLTTPKNVSIVGKLNTIKVYVENSLVLDGTDSFTEFASDRFIEIGSNGTSNAYGFFKRIAYNIDGYYEPGSSVYSNIKLEKFIDFTGMSISDIAEYEGNILVAANPLNASESGQIYKILETEKPVMASTENVDNFDLFINSFSLSPSENILSISHSKGSSFFNSYFIPKYDSNSVFVAGFDPSLNLWELIRTTEFNAISYINEGLVIDTTTSSRTYSLSTQNALITKSVEALSFISLYDTIFSYDFEIEITTNSLLNIYLTSSDTKVYSTTLIGKTLEQLVEELSSLTSSTNYFFALFYEILVLNNTNPQLADRLHSVSRKRLFPGDNFIGEYEFVDPYSPSPYGIIGTGKWSYSHRKPGTPWFERVDNSKGWTVDFDIRLDSIEDSETPVNDDKPKGMGLYVNDGVCSENLWFLPQEIVFEGSEKSFTYDTTLMTSYRLIGKKKKLKLYGKKSSDQSYKLIAESATRTKATNQGNAGRPAIFRDSNNIKHIVWHDDGNGSNKRQIYYNTFSEVSLTWGEPQLIVSDEFVSSNPDIAIDSLGNIYVVYETTKSDYTDISVITKNSQGWSEPYLITSNLYDSFSPKICVDSKNNVHVVWEDYRQSNSQIFYCRRNAANGQWESAMFGGQDIQITSEVVGAKRPSLAINNTNVYVSWTSFNRNGSSSIKMASYDEGNKKWISSGQGGSDFSVSGINASKADNSDLIIDLKGQILVVWNDIVDYNYQIFSRSINSRFVFAKPILQLTKGEFDSTHPCCGLDSKSGDIYVVFEKQQEKIDSPYDAYSARESDVSFKSASIFVIKWDAMKQRWYSSNQFVPAGVFIEPFDVEFDFGLPRQSYRPVISDRFSGNPHVLFESSNVLKSGEVISNNNLFTQVRSVNYNKSITPIYEVTSSNEYKIDGVLNRKELRFGDFSDNLATRLVVGSLKYYLSDAVEPFSISLVSPATVNIPKIPILCISSNNNGDSWLGSENGLMFYNKKDNQVFLVDSDESNIKGLKINAIAFDNKSNMYLATSSGLYGSLDHSYFFKINIGEDKINSIETDSLNNLYAGTDSGLYIINLNPIYKDMIITKENVSETNREIDVSESDIIKISTNNGLLSNKINVIRVDAGNVVWIGSDNGLVRYENKQISIFTTANGLYSNKINDISIRNTAIRYIATTSGVNKMVGISISALNFDNANSPPASVNEITSGDIKIPVFINAKAVKWKDPNILWIASSYNIFQITFVEESFTTEKTEITKFTSQDFTLTPIKLSKNDDLQVFKLAGIDDKEIPSNALFEVILNGNKITRGYSFSPKNKIIKFNYPLSESDIVKVNIRFDIEKLGDFAQNKAQQIAIGNKVTKLERLVSSSGSIYAMTGGDINTVQINDQVVDLPFDRIILDKTPPRGKISIGNRRERNVFEINVSPLEDDINGVFDETSGIDKMVVSNFQNFTSDGEESIEPMVFTKFLLHNIGDIFDSVTKQFTFPSGKGYRLLNYNPLGGDPVIMAGTSSPANIYKFNGITQLWDKIDTLDVVGGVANSSASVEFLIEFQGKVYAGTGSPNGVGKIWVMNSQSMKFDLLRTLPSNTHAYCAVVFDEVLYIGGGGGSYGALYSFDGISTKEVFKNISGAIYSLVESDRELYAATGLEGRIYKLDTKNNTQQIIDVNADRNAISIGKATVGGSNYIFAGFGSNGQIKRSKTPSSPFVHSFKTVPSPVSSIKNINGKLYAAIGNTLYVLDNVWNAKYTHREIIRDIVGGENEDVWFVSDSYIYKVGKIDNVKRVYLKLIDRAGNETNLFTNDSQTQLDTNLFAEVNINDLASFINRNRILRVDQYGNAESIREGNDRFYSSDLVDEETGEYYSEFFNGTNNLVSWDKISWDAVIPDNTDITIQVRTGATKDEILDKEFVFSVDGKDLDADISFLSGQFIQFKVIMKSRIRGLSPSLRNVVIKSISSDSTHFFTTNFVLPSRVKSGIVTSTKLLPVAADIVFGINSNNSTDFAEYQIVDENRIFTTENGQIGNGMRVGIRFITPTKAEASSLVPDEYSAYNAILFNSVEWSYKNIDGIESVYNFKVSFYEDESMTNLIYSASSSSSNTGFSVDGDIFPTGGVLFGTEQSKAFSFTPVGSVPIKCNTYYYVKIEALNDVGSSIVSDSYMFIESCGTTYVDTISFDFSNTMTDIETYHFRIRFYNDPERTDLKYTAFSGNDLTNWLVNENIIPVEGITVLPNQLISVNYTPSLSSIDANKTYYLSIDVFNGEVFENNSNSFTFKANDLASNVYCGSYSDVPIVKNFSVMFELENNEFISMKVNV